MREYYALMKSLGFLNKNCGPAGLSIDMFVKSAFILPFDLCADNCFGTNSHRAERGIIDLEIGYKYPLPKNITVYVYSVYDGTIHIDGRGQALVTLGGAEKPGKQ